MAIALTDFEMLCGFQKCHNILSNIKAHKELLELIGGEEALTELADEGPGKEKKQQAALKKIFTQVWSSTEETVQGVLQEILARIFQSKS
jgi:mannose-6-phosphate isomerase class I